jgi:hypothetical protein
MSMNIALHGGKCYIQRLPKLVNIVLVHHHFYNINLVLPLNETVEHPPHIVRKDLYTLYAHIYILLI